MTDTPTPPPAAPPGRPATSRRRWLGLGIAGIVGAVIGSAATYGAAGRHRWHRGRFGGALDLDAVNARIERGVGYALDRIDATAEQKQKVGAILRQAAADLWPLRERHRAARWALRDILAAASIDRAKLEALRAEQMQLAETASKRIVAAMADAAEALTPEQRAKLAALAERWRERRRR
jgi:Spy/CpxP family protein refolding chaperone